ncbi:hypothetical protein GIB67_005042 [Kingdonia uniflora]|uniref:Uncharacterized protein n=1 Tax=Kingdonia uniflora TaxID=39325 RepID=A0A7J7NN87_9MAGN|nr:hypothetical protein GIB67_005042 [Kingdonia uniflora]
MLYIEKGCRTGVASKLLLRKSGLYRIIRCYRENAHELDILGARSNVVNVKLLTQLYDDIPSHPVTPAPDYILPYLLGWHAFTNSVRPDEAGCSNSPSSRSGADLEWNR